MNVLLITADHMRSDALGCNRTEAPPSALAHAIQTPVLDRLAREGANFLRAYSPNPICVPARASITTGNYAHTCTGELANDGTIAPGEDKIAERFAAAGYWTAAIGKLHYLPYAEPGAPRLVHGFAHCELNEEGRMLGQFDPEGRQRGIEDYHDWLADHGWGGYERAHGVGNNDVHPSASPLPAELHEEAWVAERSIAALQAHAASGEDRPFFLWASFAKPHSPYDPPRPWDAMYDPRSLPEPAGLDAAAELLADRQPELRRRGSSFAWESLSPQAIQNIRAHYAGLVSFQDQQIGRLVDQLERQGLLDETIIIYTADHGDLLGDFGLFFKRTMLEGSVRVPMIWRVPGVTDAEPGERRQLAGLQDILPTLAGLCDLPLNGPKHGRDLGAELARSDAPGRAEIVSETVGGTYMVRDDRHKYIYHREGGVEELYDLLADPAELDNRAGVEAQRLVAFRRRLTAWARETDHAGLLDGDALACDPLDERRTVPFNARQMGWRKY